LRGVRHDCGIFAEARSKLRRPQCSQQSRALRVPLLVIVRKITSLTRADGC